MIERLPKHFDKTLLEQSFVKVMAAKADPASLRLGQALLLIDVKRSQINSLSNHQDENFSIDLAKIRKPKKGSSLVQALKIIENSEDVVDFINLDVITQAQVCQTLADKIRQRSAVEGAKKAASTIKQKYGEDFYRNIAKKAAEKRAGGNTLGKSSPAAPLEIMTTVSPIDNTALVGEIPTEKGSGRFWLRVKEAVLGRIDRIGRLVLNEQTRTGRVGGLVMVSALTIGAIMLAPNIGKLILVRDHITGGSYYDSYGPYGALPQPTVAETKVAPVVAQTPEPVRTALVVPTVSPSPSPKAPAGQPVHPIQAAETIPQLVRAEPVSPLRPAETPVPAVEQQNGVIDKITLERARIVGSYFGLIQQIADQAITEAGEFLGKDLRLINPSVRRAIELTVQFALEKLANQTSADTDPLAFDQAVNDLQLQEELKTLSYNKAINYEIADLPQHNLPEPKSEVQFIAQIAHLARSQPTLGPILRVMSQLFNQDPQRVADLVKIAAIIGEREDAIDPSQIPHVLAQYYDDPVGGEPVLRVIADNALVKQILEVQLAV